MSRTSQARALLNARRGGPPALHPPGGRPAPVPLSDHPPPRKPLFFLFSLLLLLVSAFLRLRLKFGRKTICLRTFQSQDPGRVLCERGQSAGGGGLLASEPCFLWAEKGCVPCEGKHRCFSAHDFGAVTVRLRGGPPPLGRNCGHWSFQNPLQDRHLHRRHWTRPGLKGRTIISPPGLSDRPLAPSVKWASTLLNHLQLLPQKHLPQEPRRPVSSRRWHGQQGSCPGSKPPASPSYSGLPGFQVQRA